MLETPTYFPFFMLEFYVGLKKADIGVCRNSMLELHFYVGNIDILLISMLEIPTHLHFYQKIIENSSFSDDRESSPGVLR